MSVVLIAPASASGGWDIATVDSTTNVGRFSSLAIGTDDCIVISYLDYSNNDLKFARNNGGGWQTETIDSDGLVGYHTSISTDSENNPAISYMNTTYYGSQLKWAHYNGTEWTISTIDSAGAAGLFTSLAYDKWNHPAISYFDADSKNLKYAQNDGSVWNISIIDTDGVMAKYTSLAFDAEGNPGISYADDATGNLKYATNDGLAWNITIVETGVGEAQYTSLAFTPTNNPAISYNDASTGDLKYAVLNGTEWHIETIDNGDVIAEFTSLAFDAEGNPAISYSDLSTGSLKYAKKEGINWVISTIETGGRNKYSSLAFKSTGVPFISYCDEDSGVLKCASGSASASNGTLEVTSVPDGAVIWIDGADTLELTNHTFSLAPGDYSVTVRLTGYNDPAPQIITVTEAGTANAAFNLVPSGNVTLPIALSAGWNMISVPVADPVFIVPPEAGTIYRYGDNVYEEVTHLADIQPGEGIWMAATGPCTLTVTGSSMNCYTEPLLSGWNMIGSCTEEIPFAGHLLSDPSGLLSEQIYTYSPVSGTYVTPMSCIPGCGYWIQANAVCSISIS